MLGRAETVTLSSGLQETVAVLPVPADRPAVYLLAAEALILPPGPDTVYVWPEG